MSKVFNFFIALFSNPQQLNPEKISAQVTKEVAEDLAELARTLELLIPPLSQHKYQQKVPLLAGGQPL